jgi:transposase
LIRDISIAVQEVYEKIKLPQSFLKKTEELGNEVQINLDNDLKEMNGFQKLQALSGIANIAYQKKDNSTARLALEKILRIDANQPDILRNLITIASEQKDIEAYERYWRRYIRLLLWQILKGDNKIAAYKDMFLFYLKISNEIEGICRNTENKMQDYLKQNGFLLKWLESNTALIWLMSIFKSTVHEQANLTNRDIQLGLKGNLAIQRNWTHLFYPEFEKYIGDEDLSDLEGASLQQYITRTNITHDPSFTLIRRFLEWSDQNFGLSVDADQTKLDAVCAFAWIVCNIPLRPHLMELAKGLKNDNGLEVETFRTKIAHSCNGPFSIMMNKCFKLEAPWDLFLAYFGDFGVMSYIQDNATLFYLARAYFEKQEVYNCYLIIRRIVAQISEDDTLHEKSLTELVEDLLHGLLSQFSQADDAIIGDLKYRLTGFQIGLSLKTNHINDQERAELLEMLVSKFPFENENSGIGPFIKRLNEAIEQVKTNLKYDKVLKEILTKVKTHFSKNEFGKAKAEILRLPDETDQLKEMKNEYLKQVNEAIQHKELQNLIDRSLGLVQEYVSKGNFDAAKATLNRLPSSPPEVNQIKTNWMNQVIHAENDLNEKINELKRKIRLKGFDLDSFLHNQNMYNIGSQVEMFQFLSSIYQQLNK